MKGIAPRIETVINPKKKGNKLSVAECPIVVPSTLPPTVANQTTAVGTETTTPTPVKNRPIIMSFQSKARNIKSHNQ